MDRLVDVLFRRTRLVLTCWVLVTLAAGVFAVGLEGRTVPGGEASASSQSEAVARELGKNGVPSLFVIVTGEAARPDAPGAQAMAGLRAELVGTPGVQEVTPLPLPPAAVGSGPVSVLGVVATGGVDGSIEVAHRLLHTGRLVPKGSSAFLGGYPAHREELVELSRSDLLRAEKVGLPIVCVVLLLTFGSLWATLVPLVIGLAALLGGLGAAGALAFGIPFSEYVTNAASMIGLALAVDYAMFLVQRVREMMRRGTDMDEAIRATLRTTGVAIAWSGLIVLAAEATMLLVDSRAIRTAGLGMMLVTVAAVVAALVGAPLVIRALGPRILPRDDRDRLARVAGQRVAGAHRPRRPDAESSGFWYRWGRRITSHPAPYLAGALLLLAALAVPVQDLGARVDLPSASAMPADSQVRRATEIGAAAYGAGTLSTMEIIVRGRPTTVAAQAEQMAQVLRSSPEIRAVRVLPLQEPGLQRVSLATSHGPADSRTESLVRDLRQGALRASLPGLRYDVGGESALRVDATGALFESLPLMLGVLLALVLVLFTVAMRSVVLALKGTLLVVVSLGASLGVLLTLSTTTFGARLIGWSRPEDLHPIVPITIVAMATALSTDYEVILISRIGELYRGTKDNTRAITYGVAHTGRVISSAAAIMIAVFAGFALSDVTPLKQLGVGLAFAVLIDATLVRGVLVPATMQLLGRWNWWSPLSGHPLPRRPAHGTRTHIAAAGRVATSAVEHDLSQRPTMERIESDA